jgi:hypothetical protein
MGHSISWVAFKGLSKEVGLARLHLALTGKTASLGDEACLGQRLPDDWYLVVVEGCDDQIISTPFLARLSADCEAVSGSVEEHVMFSAAEGWRNGQQNWRAAHDAQKSTRHIECQGEPPPSYAVALTEAKASQDAEDAAAAEVDFYFEVPLQVAKSIVGFKHDEECPGIDYECFEVINRAGQKPWWQWWK